MDKGKGKEVAEKGLAPTQLEIKGELHLPNTVLEAKRITQILKEHFSHIQEWEYEKLIARSANYVAVVVKSKRGNIGRRKRRVIVKRGTSNEGDRDLKIEIAWLERVRGAAHIATMLACRQDTEIPTTSARTAKLPLKERLFGKSGNVRTGMKKLVAKTDLDDELQLREMAPYPMIVLEHLEHGFVEVLLTRAIHYNAIIPNRVLWSFFLCLVRACVGLAFQRARPKGEPPELEYFREDGTPQSDLVHNRIFPQTLMLGADTKFDEHIYSRTSERLMAPESVLKEHGVPMVKLMDLGNAGESGDRLGYRYNLWDISGLMMTLATRDKTWAVSEACLYRGIKTEATPIVNAGRTAYPMIDDDLRDLLARCLATNPVNRPNLKALLAEVENAVKTKNSPDAFPWHLRGLESYDSISRFFHRCLYDADVVPGEDLPPLGDEYLTQISRTPRQRAREERQAAEFRARLDANT